MDMVTITSHKLGLFFVKKTFTRYVLMTVSDANATIQMELALQPSNISHVPI